MTTNNKSAAQAFALELTTLGAQIPALALATQQSIALRGLRGVVQKSPVDTGRFRGNWQANTGGEAPVLPRLDKRPKGSPPGPQVVAGAEAGIARAQPFGVIYLTNGLPYAQRLEDGHSQQAPGGMVALTLAELQTYVANEAEAIARAKAKGIVPS